MEAERWRLEEQTFKYKYMNVTTRFSREKLEHITGLKKAVPVFGSLRDVTRGGQKAKAK